MVQAALDLMFEGELPSSSSIAARAGVTQRTLFNQFGDMESLVAEVGRRQYARMVATAPPPRPDLDFDARVDRFTAAMAEILDEAMHIRWAVLRSGHPTALGLMGGAREWFRSRLAEEFAPELALVVPPRRGEVLDELEIALDPLAWRVRRLVQGHTRDDGAARVGDTMRAILRTAAAHPPVTDADR